MEETISPELAILSGKRSNLAAPGVRFNDLYYSRMNTTVELVECTFSQGRFFQTLSSPIFGGSSPINIPNGSFLGASYLHLELPVTVANQTLVRGWGYAAIREISFLFGSSNVPGLTISGQTLFQMMLMQSESSDKHNEWIRLAGEEHVSPAPAGTLVSADVLLPFPWSNYNGTCPKLPFDTNTLRNPITITVSFNEASSIFGGDGARPAGFINSFVTFRQGDLSNKDLSLATKLFNNPELMMAYPFIHVQSATPPAFLGTLRGSGSLCNVSLQQFISADLTGISFGVVRHSRFAPTGNNSPARLSYDELYDITLRRNGVVVYFSPGTQYKAINMESMVGGSYVSTSVIAAGTTAPFNSTPVDTYAVFIDFSRLRTTTFCNQYPNTMRIAQQTLDLSFNTQTTEMYSLFATYYYNGVNEVQNGESRITFA